MPLPFAGNPIGRPFIELQSIDSTNKYAMAIVHGTNLPDGQDESQHGMAIFAHEQTVGKGQRGKSWISEKGSNIALSIVLNPYPLSIADQFKLSVCVAVSVNELFSNYAGDETKIKWPNDLYWRDRKAGGILIESVIGSGRSEVGSQKSEKERSDSDFGPHASNFSLWQWAIVGIGINVNQTSFPSDLPNPVSLKQITGKIHDPVELAKELCIILEKNYQLLIAGNFKSLLDKYQSHLYKKGEKVKLKKDNRLFEAMIKGVAETGQLITQHSLEERFEFGEIEWIIQS